MTSRVIVEFRGGLGNQLFQLSAGLILAQRLGCPIEADVRAFASGTPRAFELAGWALPVPIIPVRHPVPNRKAGVISALRRRSRLSLSDRFSILQDTPGYSPPLRTLGPGSYYLRGYWQHRPVAEQARDTIATALAGAVSISEIGQADAIAVHVRRGDYLRDPSVLRKHGVQPASYYTRAVGLVRSRLAGRRVVIFSDDPEWAAERLSGIPNCTIAILGRPAADLFKMARCAGHVISNSTFGWWGAFLADSSAVVAPRRWFADTTQPPPDLFPESWLLL